MSKTGKHMPGEWVSIFNTKKERAVRAKSGFVCFLPSPGRYAGQDKRYEEELEEAKANAALIAEAPKFFKAAVILSENLWAYIRHYETSFPQAKSLDSMYQAAKDLQVAIDKATTD